jgi:enterochelin esterase family protein
LYGRFLTEEVIPEVEKTHKVRADGYSRAIAGESSGAVAAFTVAWFMPEKFSRVHSGIGTYTSIQWKYGNEDASKNLEGGNIYPFAIRKQPKRNIRVWLSDGMDDLENTHGSWPLQNIQMANSLKMREYDFHFRFGEAAHNGSQIALDLPESLTWLWRDYDPAKTEQTYTMDPAEKSKPYYRVKIVNREAW